MAERASTKRARRLRMAWEIHLSEIQDQLKELTKLRERRDWAALQLFYARDIERMEVALDAMLERGGLPKSVNSMIYRLAGKVQARQHRIKTELFDHLKEGCDPGGLAVYDQVDNGRFPTDAGAKLLAKAWGVDSRKMRAVIRRAKKAIW